MFWVGRGITRLRSKVFSLERLWVLNYVFGLLDRVKWDVLRGRGGRVSLREACISYLSIS